MTILADGLLDALEELDRRTAPFGLYACEEYRAKHKPFPRLHREWELALKPHLLKLGCRTGDRAPIHGETSFRLADGALMQMGMARISKIKVRRFGSAYRTDPHHHYEERWQRLRLDRALSRLWKPSASVEPRNRLDLFLFIGFAAEAEPFGAELMELHEQLRWDENRVGYHTRTWPDRYDRHFHVRLSAWMRLTEPSV